ncbi:Bax inhibitor-1/YccA family protein [Cardinium endosymbiont of Bemisia tabaci]|uniref:Bax inhibitor-1/YccA family protein n=1 Tax=Cardinium endosymbiont of Bemisia tabaci TaxID=672794 RepID=UPI000442D0A0|nr:Bax inhibitor-1/YccA family protein [Cardinium endosymbiont of Bemisia tabaci]CDG49777.1 Bacterial BAX inhibitor (BI)-1/YccA-like protein [Cardinium endosymbiont cBtQ1 of Bemisia tabaci]
MNNYINDYTTSRRAIDNGLQRYMVKVYGHMAFGLLITAIAAAATYTFPSFMRLFFEFDQWGNTITINRTFWGYVVLFAPLCISIYLSSNFTKTTFAHSRFLLGCYAALIGISLSTLAFIYTIDSLHKVFLVTAFTFSAMSIYGYTTKRDLTALGSFCMMALWGLIISGIVNFFFHSDAVDFVSSFIGVVVFTGFVAYHTQKLRTLYYEVQDTALAEKVAVMGAFQLYIDFINLFLCLLRFLGQQKRKN